MEDTATDPSALPEPTQAPGSRPKPRHIRKPLKSARPIIGPTFRHYFAAALGSIAIGITLPSILVTMRAHASGTLPDAHPLLQLLVVEALATIGCGPGAVLLSVCLFALLSNHTQKWSLQRSIAIGALGGIPVAFFNLPGYLVLTFLHKDDLALPRVALLFTVAGSSCGMWVAWHAWRAWRPQEHFVPRFTLRTLLLVVFLWGVAMLAFQPDRTPPAQHGDPFDF